MKSIAHHHPKLALLLLAWICLAPTLWATQTVARVGDRSLTEGHLAELAEGPLQEIEKQRHQILEQTLEQWIAQQLLELEAERRGLEADQLIEQEITSKSQATEEEIDAFYNTNRQRIQGDRESALPQIRAYLEQQGSAERYRAFVDTLRSQYETQAYLQPFRVEISKAGATSFGPDSAKVTLVEFSDFECPYCRQLAPVIDRLKSDFAEDLSIEFRQYPLRAIHPNAQQAAEASLCARDQGSFWEMHDALVQGGLEKDDILAAADSLGLDGETFASCLDESRHQDTVQKDFEFGLSIGVEGTPSLFVNGRPVGLRRGADPYEEIATIIRDELERNGTAASQTARAR